MARSKAPAWVPKPDDYRQVFREQNPWHDPSGTRRVPDSLARDVERPLGSGLWRCLVRPTLRRYQLVLGPRRVGKTTALYQTVRHLLAEGIEPSRLWWLRLDHPLLLPIPLGELLDLAVQSSQATAERPVFLFLDELTYARDWDLWLKTFYDEQRPVQLAGSSSSTVALRERKVESGVGRWEEQYLPPYTFTEFLDLQGWPSAVPVGTCLANTIENTTASSISIDGLEPLRRRFILTGGFPELLTNAALAAEGEADWLLESQRTLRSDAVERAVYKDIPQVCGVDNPMLLERMLYVLGGQMTGLLSPNSLCQSLNGMTQPTFDRYLSYLERAFLVFTLQNYSAREETRQRRGRKVYFVDGAVRNAALQRGLAPLSDPVEMGLLLENLAASHLKTLAELTQVRLFHWRDKHHEIDLVFDDPSQPIAFEIGTSSSHPLDGMRAFLERYPRFRGGCYLVAPNAIPVQSRQSHSGIGSLPLDLFLLCVGRQAEKALAARLAVSATG